MTKRRSLPPVGSQSMTSLLDFLDHEGGEVILLRLFEIEIMFGRLPDEAKSDERWWREMMPNSARHTALAYLDFGQVEFRVRAVDVHAN